MKKHLVTILVIIMSLTLVACSSSQTEEPTTTDSEQTIDARLDRLLDNGWTVTDGSYAWSESSDYRKLDLVVSVDGNDLVLEMDSDYGKDNESVEAAIKEDASFAAGQAARWFESIERMTEESFDNMKYTVKIGGKETANGNMTEAEATELAAEYDD